MADRCTGRCCRDFIIRRSPEEIQEQARTAEPRWKKEFTKIAEMVIPLPHRNGFYSEYHYTCKHYDANTNNCMDYENRPEMCRNYPYGDPCGFDECEWNPESPKPDVKLRRLQLSAERFTAAAAVAVEDFPGDIKYEEAKVLQIPRCNDRGEKARRDALSRRETRASGQPEVMVDHEHEEPGGAPPPSEKFQQRGD